MPCETCLYRRWCDELDVELQWVHHAMIHFDTLSFEERHTISQNKRLSRHFDTFSELCRMRTEVYNLLNPA